MTFRVTAKGHYITLLCRNIKMLSGNNKKQQHYVGYNEGFETKVQSELSIKSKDEIWDFLASCFFHNINICHFDNTCNLNTCYI